ncbi:MAG: histidinol dehydrogenase [Bacteroidetes bacterium GWE2_39_28]|nr:MAG: histidinol dehydrogenase [Bacteroidetes bacterium GWE2_39_28]OFY13580.1 MAG: histidinol dehydrogenase [Bacteroidetes bacterium GWF2_39_10]OFZ11739.1 MAG: histidinol dehydrogenase [Bacteroidetes bacterium RIFOXYC2_FULL_39_11]HCT94921.1 histidinol dehydrogenase [Rikenellaceae bacterium]
MKLFIEPLREVWQELASRPSGDNPVVELRVSEIISYVKQEGDKALYSLTQKYDGVELKSLYADKGILTESESGIDNQLKRSIDTACENIEKFHRAQVREDIDLLTTDGVRCIMKHLPVERVGLYIPGGSAPLFSTVLMLAIPARIAGCSEITLFTPPSKDGTISPAIAYAAFKAGVTNIVTVGGAQAIAAMAFGTESIRKVDKIFGPGNQYVSVAKQLVSKYVSIDMIAGPSELLVMADETSEPDFVAADLLSQAEHGSDSQVILLCNSAKLAQQCIDAVNEQKASLSRDHEIDGALETSRVIVFEERAHMVAFSNFYAPEHLIIALKNPWEIANGITAAGSVFIGNWSPESAGDYASGTNHTLPTNGWARSQGSLSLESFMKTVTFQELSREGIKNLAPIISDMAAAEGLDAHKNACEIRFRKISQRL